MYADTGRVGVSSSGPGCGLDRGIPAGEPLPAYRYVLQAWLSPRGLYTVPENFVLVFSDLF